MSQMQSSGVVASSLTMTGHGDVVKRGYYSFGGKYEQSSIEFHMRDGVSSIGFRDAQGYYEDVTSIFVSVVGRGATITLNSCYSSTVAPVFLQLFPDSTIRLWYGRVWPVDQYGQVLLGLPVRYGK